MVLRKVIAFIGLLGVISALAWQHGLFDRADAAAPAPPEAQAQPQARAEQVTKPQPKADSKNATKRVHSKH